MRALAASRFLRRTYCRLTCHRFDTVCRGTLVCRQCGWELHRTSS